MERSEQKAPKVVDGADFDPARYAGRDVVFVKVPAKDNSIGREVNFFGIKLRASMEHHPAVVGALGAGATGFELLTTRNTVGKMLMTDDQFAETFRGGALKDIRERNLDEFTRYYSRESKWGQMLTDPINRIRLQWKVGREVKERDVSFGEAIRQWRPRHWMTVLGGLSAVGVSVLSLPKVGELQAEPSPQLNAQDTQWQETLFKAVKHELPKL